MDRFGEPPRNVQNLLAVAELKALAHETDITEIKQMGESVRIAMHERAKLDVTGIPGILGKFREELKFQMENPPYFLYTPRKKTPRETVQILSRTREVTEALHTLIIPAVDGSAKRG